MAQLESAFRYLEEHVEIRDVIMSGGDPLLLSDRRIDELCRRLRAIPHLEVLRIGSRVPCHLPERITPELCAILKRYHPLYINTHFNHPDELTPAAGGSPRPPCRRRHPARLPDGAPEGA